MNLGIIKLAAASCIPIIATIVFCELDKRTNFRDMKYLYKQLCIGLIFGLIAILGTEWGIKIDGIVVNCRDAAPVAAGLIFGGPAGIIAGIIGGLERWVSVYWGVGHFTRFACSISTCFAGFFAAFLRKFLFENKKPSWGIAFATGAIMEVFHLYMVFITNIVDEAKAFTVVHTCFLPMVLANSLSVMLSVLAVNILEKEFNPGRVRKPDSTPIFETIQKWLSIVLIISFMLSISFIFNAQNNMAINDTKYYLVSVIDQTEEDVLDRVDEHMLQSAHLVAKEIKQGGYDLNDLASRYELTDISLVNKEGIIFESNNKEYVNYDMSSGEQSAEFLVLLDGEESYVQEFRATAINENVSKQYAAIATDFGFLQISYDEATLQKNIQSEIVSIANNDLADEGGGVIILDSQKNLISHSTTIDSKQLFQNASDISKIKADGVVDSVVVDGKAYYSCCKNVVGYYIVSLYLKEEANFSRNITLYLSGMAMVLIFAILYILLYLLIKHSVVKQIVQITKSLSDISGGNLEEVVDVRSSKEFSSLSDDINSTVDTLKNLVSEAAARIDAELVFAKEIQFSSLPGPWHDNSSHRRFEIAATIDTAKEVGGDFYDYYMSSPTAFNFLVADVSGKGIPAALFMMRAKSVLRGFSEQNLPVNEVFANANQSLCEGNEADMFVTAWQGKLDISSGMISYANAGHNLPIIRHADGKCEYLAGRPNFVLAGMEGIRYKIHEYQLLPGEIIFLYTDGVTEATNKDNELYGEERLLHRIHSCQFDSLEELNDMIRKDIDAFVEDAEQFDDITMLVLRYLG